MFGISLRRQTDPSAPDDSALTPFCRTGRDFADAALAWSGGPASLRYPTALALCGAFAGFACGVLAARQKNQVAADILPSDALGRTGEHLGHPTYRGALIDGPLFLDRTAFYRVLATKARALGVTHLPNIAVLVDRAGPAMPDPLEELGERPLLPRVAQHWAEAQSILGRYDRTIIGWPVSLGSAAGLLMAEARAIVPPDLAVEGVMEAAIAMSHFTPAHLDVSRPRNVQGNGQAA